jgi:hypothetical protein
VKSVDIEAAIAAVSAQRLFGTYGSVVLRFLSPSSGALYGAMMIRKTGHAVAFHIDAKGELQDFQSGGREGVWWLPKETTSDYLILANRGLNTLPLDLSLYDATGKESRQQLLLGPGQTNRYSVRKLILAAGLSGSYGGIKISANAHAGSFDTLHFLFDEAAQFSAILKMFDHDPNAKIEERTLADATPWISRAPMLALSSPDPALAFPPGTVLQPQLFIRNAIKKPVDVTLRFNWRTPTTTGKSQVPVLHLTPYETRRIDVAALQDAKMLPKEANWTSVTLTTNAQPDDVMAIAASYDATLRYGAQTPFTDQLSYKWEGGMWSTIPITVPSSPSATAAQNRPGRLSPSSITEAHSVTMSKKPSSRTSKCGSMLASSSVNACPIRMEMSCLPTLLLAPTSFATSRTSPLALCSRAK